MGRRAYQFTPAAIAAIRRLARAARKPTYRQIADHLFRRRLTSHRLDPKILWRACLRHRIRLTVRDRKEPWE